jgi:hypothetical protein
MLRPSPRHVFGHSQSAWSFLTQAIDDKFERQHFDRKEAGRPQGNGALSSNTLNGVKELVVKTLSAFANSNVEGEIALSVSQDTR